MKTSFFFLLFSLTILPNVVFANGGDQRVVENKYFINLSRAPFTPRVGVKTSMLASFVDIEKNKLIAEDLIVKVRIAKLGGVGTNKRDFLFEKDNMPVRGGVLELPYTFTETGLHEVFFDFAFTSNPQKIYEVPDFLIDIQQSLVEQKTTAYVLVIGITSGIAGLLIGLFFGRKLKT